MAVPLMPSVLRIIDANANRAREAIRVMEDAARFLLDDADLCAALKQLRHDLAAALGTVDGLEASRDTPGDVGTQVRTETESQRASAADVAVAAGKRLSEALRSIEEYGKVLGEAASGLGAEIEQLRYRGYDIEQRLTRAMGAMRPMQWRLCVLVTESLCTEHPGRWDRVMHAAIAGGADCIQIREKHLDDAELLHRVQTAVAACRPQRVSVIVNDRPDIALISGADGVHLGQNDLPCRQVRRIVGRQLIVGVSTSRLDQARQAMADGADYCGVGPMFDTTTKHKDTIVGPEYLRQYIAWAKLPYLAIGGIGPDNIDQLINAGVAGVAVSSAICAAPDPESVTRAIVDHLPPATK